MNHPWLSTSLLTRKPSIHAVAGALICLLLLTSCSNDTPEAMLDDYLSRVENTLDVKVERTNPYQHLIPFPRRRDRRLEVTELRTGLLDSIGFSRCDLLPLIAERNSSLGKVMKPSTLLNYELRFFARLEPCYRQYLTRTPRSEDDLEFGQLLTETYSVKSANLEAEVWNGIFTSEAMEKNFSLSRHPVPLEGNPGVGNNLRALEAFNKIVDGIDVFRVKGIYQLPKQLQQLEVHYFALDSSEYGSQLIKSLALLTFYLNRSAKALEKAMDRRPICFNKKPTATANILQNIFIKYYAESVQPYLALIQREGEAWLLLTTQLLDPARLPVPQKVQNYHRQMLHMNEPQAPWPSYQRAIKRHTQAWQTLLTQCGLMPRSASN